MEIELVHISEVRAGDCILHDGAPHTVCAKDIKRDSFMGISIFGDTYKLGYQPVARIIQRA